MDFNDRYLTVEQASDRLAMMPHHLDQLAAAGVLTRVVLPTSEVRFTAQTVTALEVKLAAGHMPKVLLEEQVPEGEELQRRVAKFSQMTGMHPTVYLVEHPEQRNEPLERQRMLREAKILKVAGRRRTEG